MSEKKTTRNRKNEQPDAATADASFDSEDHQADKSVANEEDSSGVESAGAEPIEHSKTRDVTPQGKGGGLIAWLALFAAILALVAFSIGFFGDRGSAVDSRADDAAIAAVSAAVRTMQDSLASLQQDVTAMADDLTARASDIATIERRFVDRLRQFESIPGRMSTIESTVSSLQGISTGVQDAWLLAEAEYYMQIANAQLQLAGNPLLASLALGLADERIVQLANPALTDVRRALSNELRALEFMAKPDTEGVTLTLASLASVVDSLPLRQDIDLPEEEDSKPDPELTGTDRALASLKSAFDSAVSVRRLDAVVRPFIAPEAQYFLRANLALQLQAARLALLRSEESIFEHSLDDAAAWLTEYYDTKSTPVQSALQTIADIRGSALSVAIPDISESLRLLRQFNALADAITAPYAESTDEIAAEPEQ